MGRFTGVTAMVLVLAGMAAAPAELQPGTRVRLRLVGGGRVQGMIGNMDDESVFILPDGQVQATSIPRAELERVEISTGRHSNVLKAALGGAALGLTLGLTMPLDDCRQARTSDSMCTRGEAIGGMTFAGTAVGAIVGWGIKVDRWVPINNVRLGVKPTAGGVGVAITGAF